MAEHKELVVDLVALFEEAGVKFKENSTGELILDSCYNCGKSKKMYISKKNGLFKCFSCNEQGNCVKIIAKLLDKSFKDASKIAYGIEGMVSASPKALMEEEEAEESLSFNLTGLKKGSVVKELKLPDVITLGPEFKPLTPAFTEAWNYLKKRGYKDEDIQKAKLLVLPYATFSDAWRDLENKFGKDQKEKIKDIAKYQGRVIFPVYVEGQVYGIVARDYTGEKDPKVLNSVGGWRSSSFWNYDNAKDSETLIICEGNSSAVKCGIDRSIALLGKVATPDQIRLIRKMKAKKLYVCLDIGTEKEQQAIYQSLALFYPGKIFQIVLPNHIAYKGRNISQELVDKIFDETKVKIELKENYFIINPAQKEKLYKVHFKSDKFKLKFTPEELDLIEYISKKGEFIDAGDYSHEEMEAFINQAQPFKGGPSL